MIWMEYYCSNLLYELLHFAMSSLLKQCIAVASVKQIFTPAVYTEAE
jgi:hypothetical protein